MNQLVAVCRVSPCMLLRQGQADGTSRPATTPARRLTHSRSENMMMKKTLVKRRTADMMTAKRKSLQVVGQWTMSRQPLRASNVAGRPCPDDDDDDDMRPQRGTSAADHASPDIVYEVR